MEGKGDEVEVRRSRKIHQGLGAFLSRMSSGPDDEAKDEPNKDEDEAKEEHKDVRKSRKINQGLGALLSRMSSEDNQEEDDGSNRSDAESRGDRRRNDRGDFRGSRGGFRGGSEGGHRGDRRGHSRDRGHEGDSGHGGDRGHDREGFRGRRGGFGGDGDGGHRNHRRGNDREDFQGQRGGFGPRGNRPPFNSRIGMNQDGGPRFPGPKPSLENRFGLPDNNDRFPGQNVFKQRPVMRPNVAADLQVRPPNPGGLVRPPIPMMPNLMDIQFDGQPRGLSPAQMEPVLSQGPNIQNPMNQGAMNEGSMNIGPMDRGPMMRGPMGEGMMNQGPMGRGPMGQGPMEQNLVGQRLVGDDPMGLGPMNRGPMNQGPMEPFPMGRGRIGEETMNQGPGFPGPMNLDNMNRGPANFDNMDRRPMNPDNMDRRPMNPDNMDRRPMNPDNMDRRRMNVDNMDRGLLNPDNMDRLPMHPDNLDRRPMNPDNMDRRRINQDNIDRGPMNSDNMDLRPMNPDNMDRRPMNPDNMDRGPMIPGMNRGPMNLSPHDEDFMNRMSGKQPPMKRTQGNQGDGNNSRDRGDFMKSNRFASLFAESGQNRDFQPGRQPDRHLLPGQNELGMPSPPLKPGNLRSDSPNVPSPLAINMSRPPPMVPTPEPLIGGRTRSEMIKEIDTSENPGLTAKKLLADLGRKVDLKAHKELVAELSKTVADRTEYLLRSMMENQDKKRTGAQGPSARDLYDPSVPTESGDAVRKPFPSPGSSPGFSGGPLKSCLKRPSAAFPDRETNKKARMDGSGDMPAFNPNLPPPVFGTPVSLPPGVSAPPRGVPPPLTTQPGQAPPLRFPPNVTQPPAGQPVSGPQIPGIPGLGVPTSVQGVPPPMQGVPRPALGVPPPGQGMLPTIQGIPPSSQGIQFPVAQGILPTTQGIPPPAQGILPPTQGILPNAPGLLLPSQGILPPAQGLPMSAQGLVPPSQGALVHSHGLLPHTQGVSLPSQGIAPPVQGVPAPTALPPHTLAGIRPAAAAQPPGFGGVFDPSKPPPMMTPLGVPAPVGSAAMTVSGGITAPVTALSSVAVPSPVIAPTPVMAPAPVGAPASVVGPAPIVAPTPVGIPNPAGAAAPGATLNMVSSASALATSLVPYQTAVVVAPVDAVSTTAALLMSSSTQPSAEDVKAMYEAYGYTYDPAYEKEWNEWYEKYGAEYYAYWYGQGQQGGKQQQSQSGASATEATTSGSKSANKKTPDESKYVINEKGEKLIAPDTISNYLLKQGAQKTATGAIAAGEVITKKVSAKSASKTPVVLASTLKADEEAKSGVSKITFTISNISKIVNPLDEEDVQVANEPEEGSGTQVDSNSFVGPLMPDGSTEAQATAGSSDVTKRQEVVVMSAEDRKAAQREAYETLTSVSEELARVKEAIFKSEQPKSKSQLLKLKELKTKFAQAKEKVLMAKGLLPAKHVQKKEEPKPVHVEPEPEKPEANADSQDEEEKQPVQTFVNTKVIEKQPDKPAKPGQYEKRMQEKKKILAYEAGEAIAADVGDSEEKPLFMSLRQAQIRAAQIRAEQIKKRLQNEAGTFEEGHKVKILPPPEELEIKPAERLKKSRFDPDYQPKTKESEQKSKEDDEESDDDDDFTKRLEEKKRKQEEMKRSSEWKKDTKKHSLERKRLAVEEEQRQALRQQKEAERRSREKRTEEMGSSEDESSHGEPSPSPRQRRRRYSSENRRPQSASSVSSHERRRGRYRNRRHRKSETFSESSSESSMESESEVSKSASESESVRSFEEFGPRTPEGEPEDEAIVQISETESDFNDTSFEQPEPKRKKLSAEEFYAQACSPVRRRSESLSEPSSLSPDEDLPSERPRERGSTRARGKRKESDRSREVTAQPAPNQPRQRSRNDRARESSGRDKRRGEPPSRVESEAVIRRQDRDPARDPRIRRSESEKKSGGESQPPETGSTRRIKGHGTRTILLKPSDQRSSASRSPGSARGSESQLSDRSHKSQKSEKSAKSQKPEKSPKAAKAEFETDTYISKKYAKENFKFAGLPERFDEKPKPPKESKSKAKTDAAIEKTKGKTEVRTVTVETSRKNDDRKEGKSRSKGQMTSKPHEKLEVVVAESRIEPEEKLVIAERRSSSRDKVEMKETVVEEPPTDPRKRKEKTRVPEHEDEDKVDVVPTRDPLLHDVDNDDPDMLLPKVERKYRRRASDVEMSDVSSDELPVAPAPEPEPEMLPAPVKKKERTEPKSEGELSSSDEEMETFEKEPEVVLENVSSEDSLEPEDIVLEVPDSKPRRSHHRKKEAGIKAREMAALAGDKVLEAKGGVSDSVLKETKYKKESHVEKESLRIKSRIHVDQAADAPRRKHLRKSKSPASSSRSRTPSIIQRQSPVRRLSPAKLIPEPATVIEDKETAISSEDPGQSTGGTPTRAYSSVSPDRSIQQPSAIDTLPAAETPEREPTVAEEVTDREEGELEDGELEDSPVKSFKGKDGPFEAKEHVEAKRIREIISEDSERSSRGRSNERSSRKRSSDRERHGSRQSSPPLPSPPPIPDDDGPPPLPRYSPPPPPKDPSPPRVVIIPRDDAPLRSKKQKQREMEKLDKQIEKRQKEKQGTMSFEPPSMSIVQQIQTHAALRLMYTQEATYNAIALQAQAHAAKKNTESSPAASASGSAESVATQSSSGASIVPAMATGTLPTAPGLAPPGTVSVGMHVQPPVPGIVPNIPPPMIPVRPAMLQPQTHVVASGQPPLPFFNASKPPPDPNAPLSFKNTPQPYTIPKETNSGEVSVPTTAPNEGQESKEQPERGVQPVEGSLSLSQVTVTTGPPDMKSPAFRGPQPDVTGPLRFPEPAIPGLGDFETSSPNMLAIPGGGIRPSLESSGPRPIVPNVGARLLGAPLSVASAPMNAPGLTVGVPFMTPGIRQDRPSGVSPVAGLKGLGPRIPGGSGTQGIRPQLPGGIQVPVSGSLIGVGLTARGPAPEIAGLVSQTQPGPVLSVPGLQIQPGLGLRGPPPQIQIGRGMPVPQIQPLQRMEAPGPRHPAPNTDDTQQGPRLNLPPGHSVPPGVEPPPHLMQKLNEQSAIRPAGRGFSGPDGSAGPGMGGPIRPGLHPRGIEPMGGPRGRFMSQEVGNFPPMDTGMPLQRMEVPNNRGRGMPGFRGHGRGQGMPPSLMDVDSGPPSGGMPSGGRRNLLSDLNDEFDDVPTGGFDGEPMEGSGFDHDGQRDFGHGGRDFGGQDNREFHGPGGPDFGGPDDRDFGGPDDNHFGGHGGPEFDGGDDGDFGDEFGDPVDPDFGRSRGSDFDGHIGGDFGGPRGGRGPRGRGFRGNRGPRPPRGGRGWGRGPRGGRNQSH